MRNTSSLLQSCIALLLCIGLLAQAQHDTSNEDEVVAPLVLPEVKALPAYSFRGPFPEGAKIGGFEVTGQATRLSTSPDFIRLTPPIPLSNGAIFSTSSVKSKEWIVEVAVRVHGATRQGGSKGGRGFGFWYTKSGSPTKGQQPAAQTHSNHDSKVSFFGQNINFDGLGIVFDSAPSVPLLPRSDPAGWAFGADTTGVISAIIDDGKTGNKWYDDYKSGERRQPGQEAKYLESSVGECEAAFRNAPGLVWVRIAHFDKMIRVDLDLQPHTTLTPEKRHFTHHCFTVKDVALPSGYHFGLTGLSAGNTDPDSVDIYAFDAWEVTGAADGQQHSQPVIDKSDTTSFKPLAGTEDSSEEVRVGSLQEIVAAQSRMTEAIDALARRIDAMQQKIDSRPAAVAGSGDYSRQLQEISAAVSRLTGQHPSQAQSGSMSAEELEQQSVQYLVKMMTRLSADVNGITVRLDGLATRVNKNIAAVSSRLGEVFTLTARTEKWLVEGPGNKRGLNFARAGKWLGGLLGCLVVFVAVNRVRKNRSGSGGRGRKMI